MYTTVNATQVPTLTHQQIATLAARHLPRGGTVTSATYHGATRTGWHVFAISYVGAPRPLSFLRGAKLARQGYTCAVGGFRGGAFTVPAPTVHANFYFCAATGTVQVRKCHRPYNAN